MVFPSVVSLVKILEDGRMTDPTFYVLSGQMPNGLDPAFTAWAVWMGSTAVDASLAERESER